MMIWIQKNKKFLLIVGVGLILLVLYRIYPSMEGKEENEYFSFEDTLKEDDLITNESVEKVESSNTVIMVDVKGAVKYPGVYEMNETARVNDAIKTAGGLLENAEEDAINFAMRLSDEMVIHVPFVGEEGSVALTEMSQQTTNSQGEAENNVININKASEEELQEIPGIGPSKAKAIIEYRETNGTFTSKEQMKEISGIGEKTYEKLESYITVK
ncbi:MAG TPA: helix-hairpin-helix domain-containing protein [Niallia sp.]|nr:helix-hairpin-helix domain-containing protein [Niallia sp.]